MLSMSFFPLFSDWHSAAPFDVVVYWVDFDGVEKPSMTLSAGLKETGSTFVGHVSPNAYCFISLLCYLASLVLR